MCYRSAIEVAWSIPSAGWLAFLGYSKTGIQKTIVSAVDSELPERWLRGVLEVP